MSHKPNLNKKCEYCGKDFACYRGKNRTARFCSLDCYWKSKEPARNTLNWKNKQENGEKPGRKRVYVGRVDGKPKYMLRSHYVWNMNHPDDTVKPSEYVHHIDHNMQNDAPENLTKMTISEHQIYHAKQISDRSKRMKSYHDANPGKARKGQVKTCPVCGKEFYRPPSAKAVTCSYKCMGKLRTMH